MLTERKCSYCNGIIDGIPYVEIVNGREHLLHPRICAEEAHSDTTFGHLQVAFSYTPFVRKELESIEMKLVKCDECDDPLYAGEATFKDGFCLCPKCARSYSVAR